jgi:hypothetical protein
MLNKKNQNLENTVSNTFLNNLSRLLKYTLDDTQTNKQIKVNKFLLIIITLNYHGLIIYLYNK